MSIFDSKLNRGRFLLVLFAVAVIASRLLTNCGADAADKEAARRASEIRAALEGRKPADLAPAFVPGFSQTMPGGPYDFVGPGPDGGLRAGVQIHRGTQWRCVRVELAADGALSVRTSDSEC